MPSVRFARRSTRREHAHLLVNKKRSARIGVARDKLVVSGSHAGAHVLQIAAPGSGVADARWSRRRPVLQLLMKRP